MALYRVALDRYAGIRGASGLRLMDGIAPSAMRCIFCSMARRRDWLIPGCRYATCTPFQKAK